MIYNEARGRVLPVFPTGEVGQASVKPGPACQDSWDLAWQGPPIGHISFFFPAA